MQKYTRILPTIARPVQAILLGLNTVLLGEAICASDFWNAAWVMALVGVVIIIQPSAAQSARYAYCPIEVEH